MANIIKIKRGLSSNIGSANLEVGELAITTDTYELYTGTNKSKPKLLNSTNATTANKVNHSLTLLNNGTTIVFDGSADGSIIIPTVHYGSGVPNNALGQDGDIYMVIAPATINFTIGGDSHTALEGMTWQQWVDSDYNIIDAFVSEYSDGNRIEYIDGSNGRYICEYRTPTEKFTYANEVIIANHDYDDSYKYPV